MVPVILAVRFVLCLWSSVLQYSMPLCAPIGCKFEIKGKGRVVGVGLGPILGGLLPLAY